MAIRKTIFILTEKKNFNWQNRWLLLLENSHWIADGFKFAVKIGESKKHIFFLLFSDEIKVDSWWRWLFWHCSYCFCKCDAPGPNSDRYWSLKPVISDIESNKVITGVRFVKKDRVIQIEIEESAAMPEGTV